MSYEVTASRMRPQSFDELTGQEFVVSTLKSSIEKKRIAHAYLFSGPRGVGKTSAARILARSLNCLKGPAAIPCGECTNCLEIKKGNSLDVIEIDGASNTGVSDIREIKEEVLFSPNNSKYKIYIIDEVHMLSNSAFNALLKTIEEPPPYIVFIFATTEIHKVPATIRSRCQQFNFRLIPIDQIKDLLKDICEDLNLTYEEDALFWIAKESTGSLRDAYTLFDQVISFTEGEISLEKIRLKLGLVGLDQMNSLAELMVDHKTGEVMILADNFFNKGVSVEQFIVDLTEYFRNILFLKIGITKDNILGYKSSRFSQKVLDNYSVYQLEKALAILMNLFKEIKYSINQRYELELTLSRLCLLDRYIDQRELLDKIEGLKRSLISETVKLSADSLHTPYSAKNINSRKDRIDTTNPQDPQRFSISQEVEKTDIESNITKPNFQNESKEDNLSINREVQSTIEANAETEKDLEQDENKQESEAITPVNFIHQMKKEIKKKITVSTAIEKAVVCKFEKDTLYISFRNSFEANIVKKEIKFLNDISNEVAGFPVDIEIKVDLTEKKETNASLDETVELVKNVFRGQIV